MKTKNRSKRGLWLAVAVLIGCASPGARADTIAWTNTAGGNFATAANWNPNRVPASNDVARFHTGSGTTFEVRLAANTTNYTLSGRSGAVVVDLNGFAYTLDATNKNDRSGEFGYFSGDNAVLTLTNSSPTQKVVDFRHKLQVGGSGVGTLIVAGTQTLAQTHFGGIAVLRRMQVANGGTLKIVNGARFNATNDTLTIDFGGRIIVEGRGSIANRLQNVNLAGLLIATNGGAIVADGNGIINISKGTVLLNQGGTLTGPRLHVGNTAGQTGGLEIRNGGILSVGTYRVVIGTVVNGVGYVLVSGRNSRLACPGTYWYQGVYIGGTESNGGNGSMGVGTLTVADGGLVDAPRFKVWRTGTLLGDGTIKGNVVNRGMVKPGYPLGTLTITNSFTNYEDAGGLQKGTLAFELGGTGSGQSDRLAVVGTLTLAGTCTVSLVNGFLPRNGDTFDLLDWTTRNGTFDALNLPALRSGEWLTNHLYTTGELTARIRTGAQLLIR